MYKVKISNEYMIGPIIVYGEDGIPVFYKLIENDDKIQIISDRISDLYDSFYEFDSHNQACWFNYEKEKKNKKKMLSLLKKLIDRLNEINDGSFEIEDLETEKIKNL